MTTPNQPRREHLSADRHRELTVDNSAAITRSIMALGNGIGANSEIVRAVQASVAGAMTAAAQASAAASAADPR